MEESEVIEETIQTRSDDIRRAICHIRTQPGPLRTDDMREVTMRSLVIQAESTVLTPAVQNFFSLAVCTGDDSVPKSFQVNTPSKKSVNNNIKSTDVSNITQT